MIKGYCYIPKTATEYEYDVNDEYDLIDTIKEMEDVKAIPASWRLSIVKDGRLIELNRSALARRKAQSKKN